MKPETLRELLIEMKAKIGTTLNADTKNWQLLELAEMILKELEELKKIK